MRCSTYLAVGALCLLTLPACGSSSAGLRDGTGGAADGAAGATDGGGGLAEREPDSAVSGAGAGGDSAAPGSGGAGGADDDVPLPRGLLLAIEVYQNGGEADLDEDGELDLEVDLDDTQHVARLLEGGEVLLTVTRLSDGTTTKLGDLDRDGELDYREDEAESAQGFRRSTERDVDFDGVSDERESFEIDLASGQTHLRREVFDGEAWQVASEETDVSGFVGAGVSEGCTDYVPTDLKSNREVNVFGHVRIVQCAADSAGNCIPASRQGNRRGGCNPAQAKQIKQALAKLFQVGLSELGSLSENAIRESSVAKCLEKRRPGLLDGLLNNVARGGAGLGDESGSSGIFSGTRFSCGISCDPGSRVSLGSTSRLRRERVNLNPSQSSTELLDTLLHEMLHSAGYDGTPNHDAEQDDYVYACSSWCTGRGVLSDENPKADARVEDCFKCSSTAAAKQECCGDKTVCVDRCCDKACGANGKCLVDDPCDPKANGGDFEQCVLIGESALIGVDTDCETDVRWTFHSVLKNGQVRLVPSSGTTTCTLDTGTCSAAPLFSELAAGDGELLLDYSGEQPTYYGTGLTRWNVTIVCPDIPQPQTVPLASNWFAQPTPKAFTRGGPLPGVNAVPDGALQWLWRYFR